MGDVIELKERRAHGSRSARSRRAARGGRPAFSGRPAFFFNLACPFSYLAGERVQRVLGEVEWIPTAAVALRSDEPWGRLEAARVDAERRASALRLPLVWPDRFPADCPRALRAAAYAAEIGACDRFALAACRLAYCGGFDLQDPEVLAEAAAAASVPVDACLAAAVDVSRDGPLQVTARALRASGVRRLPAIRAGRRCFDGERAVGEVAALLRGAAAYGGPLAPAS